MVRVHSRRETLVSDDHASEGVIVMLPDGNILHIFRFDPGLIGDHVRNSGYIAKRHYSNGVWSDVETVYNSGIYDDRNIHGGITNEGRIVLFFRRYDASSGITEGHYFIYSDDGGASWSDLKPMDVSPKSVVIYGTGQMFYNPEIEKYCIVGYSTDSYCEIRFSEDGSNWDEKVVIAEGTDFNLSEIAGAYCGNRRMIVIERDDNRRLGHPLVQMVSYDNGQSWSEPVQTNIPPNMFWGCAPQLLWDEENNTLIAMNSDRRGYHGGNYDEESLYIYYARPSNIFSDTQNWTLGARLVRPKTNSNSYFYGYPTIAKTSDNNYFIVYTDSELISGKEDADLYQFEMELVLSEPLPPIDPSSSAESVVPFMVDNGQLSHINTFVKYGDELVFTKTFKTY